MLETSPSSRDVSSMPNEIGLVSLGGLEAEMWSVENFPWRVFDAYRCVKSVRVAVSAVPLVMSLGDQTATTLPIMHRISI